MVDVGVDFTILSYNWIPKKFISLFILIIDKRLLSSTNIHVFICPLLNKLQALWCGIVAFNLSQSMWNISNFLAYGLIFVLFVRFTKATLVADHTRTRGWQKRVTLLWARILPTLECVLFRVGNLSLTTTIQPIKHMSSYHQIENEVVCMRHYTVQAFTLFINVRLLLCYCRNPH